MHLLDEDSIGSFRIRVSFCSHRGRDGESGDRVRLTGQKKRATFLARASTLYSFLFEDITLIERELGPTDAEAPEKRETIMVKRHYRPRVTRL